MAAPTPRSTTPVLVTLTPTNDPSDTRTILLQLGTPITIGRSSRSEPKNLIQGAHNALFENPVISRKHAQLTLSSYTSGAVNITDLGSMHGTTVNGEKLRGSELRRLNTGDVVKLGDEVVRSMDKHDGLILTIDIASQPSIPGIPTYSKATTTFANSFTVPDLSDSDYDSENSEQIESYKGVTSSAQTTPEQGSDKIGSQRAPIDVDEPASYNNVIETGSKESAAVIESVQERVIPDTYAWDHYDEAYAMSENGSAIHDDEMANLSDEDDDDGDNSIASGDEGSDMAESDAEDEAPEVLSSRREASPELGTGSFNSVVSVTEAAAATKKPHYDPVRGYDVPQTTPNVPLPRTAVEAALKNTARLYASTQPVRSTRPDPHSDFKTFWDASTRRSVDDVYLGHGGSPWGSGSAYQHTHPTYMASQHYPYEPTYGYPSAPLPAVPAYQAAPSKNANKVDIMNLVENRAAQIEERIAPAAGNKLKRKASEIADDVPAFAPCQNTQFFEARGGNSATQAPAVQVRSEAEIDTTSGASATSTNDAAPVDATSGNPAATVDPFAAMTPAELDQMIASLTDLANQPPPAKKTKLIKKALSHAAKAGGYMAVGGALTIAFLASPAAETLLGAL